MLHEASTARDLENLLRLQFRQVCEEEDLKYHFRGWVLRALIVWTVAFLSPLLAVAQKTVVKDAGAGAKEEVDYDARGRIVEGRTIGADGTLLVRIIYHYSPTYELVTKTTNTSYWPDGKSAEKVAENTFDESTNFISEIIQDYDQSGKHVSGHQLFHDPMTGIYRCFDWKVDPQKYVAIDCPESEESHEGPHDTPTITRDEVMQQLAAAHQAAQAEEKSRRIKPKAPVQLPITTINKEVGIILPARMRPGQRVSGTLTDNPDRFAGEPDLVVTRLTLPMESVGDASQLDGWTFEMKNIDPQPADRRFSFVVLATPGPIEFTLRQAGDPAIAVSGKVQVPKTATQKMPAPKNYESPALCFKGDLCTVTGSFSGDSRNTFAAFGSVPANVVAETETSAFLEVPVYMNLGQTALIVAEGTKVAAMMMVVAQLDIEPNHEATQAGTDTVSSLRVDGVAELSDDQWHYGVYPASNLEKARALVPGFNPAKVVEQERERREKQEKQDGMKKKDDKKEESAGMVLVVVQNTTPDVTTMRAAKQQKVEFHLAPDSFAMGDFSYNIAVDALKSGTYVLKATAIPFLAPVKAQEFEAEPAASKK